MRSSTTLLLAEKRKLLQLIFDNVSKQSRGGNWALRNFSLQLGPGVLGLLGALSLTFAAALVAISCATRRARLAYA